MTETNHNLLDWNQIHSRVLSIRQISGHDNDQQAFSQMVIERILDLSADEAMDAATDGTKDRGIDAIVIDDREGKNDIHLFSFKYAGTFRTSERNFPGSEIDKVLTFISDVFGKSEDMELTCNQLLFSKVTDIWDAMRRPSLAQFFIHFCSNTWALNDSDLERCHSSVRHYRTVTIIPHSCRDLSSTILATTRRPIARTIKLVDTHHFDRSDGDIRGLIGITTAEEISNLVRNITSPNEICLDIFDNNVRIYLTLKNKINRKIYDTALSDENYQFWYLNNGITITCDTLEYPPKVRQPSVTMTNVQIVNGGQTTNALFEAFRANPDQVRDVLVLARIYETRKVGLSSRIAEATNSQTPIKSRDLRSNDIVQKKIEDMLISLGYYWERKSSAYSDRPIQKRVDMVTAGQAILSYYEGLPEIAKKDKARIVGDHYDDVFDDDKLNPSRILTPFLLYRQIDQAKKRIQRSIKLGMKVDIDELILIDGSYHVLYAIGSLADSRGINKDDFDASVVLFDEARQFVAKAVAARNQNDKNFSYSRFFKDGIAKRHIEAAISGS